MKGQLEVCTTNQVAGMLKRYAVTTFNRAVSVELHLQFLQKLINILIMNQDSVALALDRLSFYTKDAFLTLTQVRELHPHLGPSSPSAQCICKP